MAATREARSIITDKVVLAQTGATLEEWYRHLDDLGAQKMSSQEIFALTETIEGLEPLGEWNRGLLSTSYQWSRGLRERGQKANGFEISMSKTVNVPVPVLYQALVDPDIRSRWLADSIQIRKTTENKSARVTWADGTTSLSIDLYSKGETKSQIVVQHLKIADAVTAAKLKEFWSERLDLLKSTLGSSEA